MMIAIAEEEGSIFAGMTVKKFTSVLKNLAKRVRLETLRKHPRGPKRAPSSRERQQQETTSCGHRPIA
jgi:hypothetical protein